MNYVSSNHTYVYHLIWIYPVLHHSSLWDHLRTVLSSPPQLEKNQSVTIPHSLLSGSHCVCCLPQIRTLPKLPWEAHEPPIDLPHSCKHSGGPNRVKIPKVGEWLFVGCGRVQGVFVAGRSEAIGSGSG